MSGVRNLHDTSVEFDPACNIISGRNASGKTSLLEAIHVLARVRSFRTARLDRVRSEGLSPLRVQGRVDDGGVRHWLGVGRDGGGTRVRIDGADARGFSELARLLPVQVMNTESHRLLQDGPSARRSYLDWTVFHVEQEYHRIWQRYDRGLRQRNAALRSSDLRSVRALEPQLVTAAQGVDVLRQASVVRLKPLIAAYLRRWLPDVSVDLSYRRGWRQQQSLAAALGEQRESEHSRGYTMVGPHRADVQIRVDGVEAQYRLSRGQQKLVAIALLLAQADLISAAHGPRPVLLVDDLPAELDALHRDLVMEGFLCAQGQLFLTTIEPAWLPVSSARRFHMEQGHLREVI